jgi:hypothetical protein
MLLCSRATNGGMLPSVVPIRRADSAPQDDTTPGVKCYGRPPAAAEIASGRPRHGDGDVVDIHRHHFVRACSRRYHRAALRRRREVGSTVPGRPSLLRKPRSRPPPPGRPRMVERHADMPAERRMPFRIGIDQGDVVHDVHESMVTASTSGTSAKHATIPVACAFPAGVRGSARPASMPGFSISVSKT